MFREDNLIFKVYGNNKLMAVKLWSAPNKEPGKSRVVKAKFEFREFDKRRQQGDKTTGQVDVYMDIEKFGYICNLLQSGNLLPVLDEMEKAADYETVCNLIKVTRPDIERMLQFYGTWSVEAMDALMLKDLKSKLIQKLIEQGGNSKQYTDKKPSIQHFSGTNDSKSIQISHGDRQPVMIVGQQGPGIKGNNGQTIPDYKSWNEQNSKKIYIGLSDEDAVKLGMCGLRAISMLDIWTAQNIEEAELARINPVSQKADNQQNASFQGGYAEPQSQLMPDERYAQEIAAQQRGFNQTGYPQDYGYARQGYADNGYGQQPVWR